jgi:hypothetical protein
MARIAIITSGHFSTSPRVWREADALAAANHDVTVIGVRFDPEQTDIEQQMLRGRPWRYIAAADLCQRSWTSRVNWNYQRFRARWARWRTLLGGSDPHALGYAVDSLLKTVQREKPELTILHLESALWVGTRLIRQGFRVGVDIEDWHSENQTNDLKRHRVLRRLESEVFPAAVHATTTSHALASAISSTFGIREPVVIYNGDPSVNLGNPAPLQGPLRMLWFSQTVGLDRGLGDLFAVLSRLQGDWRLEIRGKASSQMLKWLEKSIPAAVRSRVHLESPVPPDRLMGVIAQHDLGLALEPPISRNRDLTVSNKTVQYLQAGLSVLSTDTAGAREVHSVIPEAVVLYPNGKTSILADCLNDMIRNRQQLVERRGAIHGVANEIFGYEHQASGLLSSIDRALEIKQKKGMVSL